MYRRFIVKHKSPINAIYLQHRQVNVFAEFKKSLERQYKENQELQKDVKLLSSKGQEVADSEAVKKTKQVISKTGEATSKVARAVGGAIDATLKTAPVQFTGKVVSKTAEGVTKAVKIVAEPVLETKAAKTVTKGIKQIKYDVAGVTGNTQFAEYTPKSIRDERKEELEKRKNNSVKIGAHGLPQQNIGTLPDNESVGIEIHASSRFAKAWETVKESTIGKSFHDMNRRLEESENPLLRTWRSLKQKTKSEDNETVKAIRMIRTLDPGFTMNGFFDEAVHFIIPDLLEAYLARDSETIAKWMSEAQFASTKAEFDRTNKIGLISHSKLLDYRDFDFKVMFLEDYPMIIITFQSDEIHVFKNKKGEIKLGDEGNIKNVRYSLAFVKRQLIEPEADYDPDTKGWMLIQMAHT